MKDTTPENRRAIRSFVLRGGRLTDGQSRAIEAHWDRFVVPFSGQPLDLQGLFPQPGPVILEIGFGMGESLLTQAEAHPGRNYLGIEVHLPGVGKTLLGAAQRNLQNLRVIHHDAQVVVQQGIPAGSLAGIQVFFPDPWHKKRHHKRRLIQLPFVAMLTERLQPGGFLHLATDWGPYAEHMHDVLQASPGLRNLAAPEAYLTATERPETKFERRGRQLGHGVWDLVYERIA